MPSREKVLSVMIGRILAKTLDKKEEEKKEFRGDRTKRQKGEAQG